jgi:hypothetical protein
MPGILLNTLIIVTLLIFKQSREVNSIIILILHMMSQKPRRFHNFLKLSRPISDAAKIAPQAVTVKSAAWTATQISL